MTPRADTIVTAVGSLSTDTPPYTLSPIRQILEQGDKGRGEQDSPKHYTSYNSSLSLLLHFVRASQENPENLILVP